MNSTKCSNSCVQCPHCAVRLDIVFSPQVAKPCVENEAFTVVAIPDESGDSIKNQFLLKKTEKDQQINIFNQMSQTKEKEKALAPPEYIVCPSYLPNPPAKSRASKSHVNRRSYGKNTIFRLPGNPPGTSSSLNARSRSFTITPANANVAIPRPPTINNVTTRNPITALPTPNSSTTPYICSNSLVKDSQHHAISRCPTYTKTTSPKPLHDDIGILEVSSSSKGLDSVEIATLYDSSASSSCESLTQRISGIALPNCSPRSQNSNNPSLTSLGFSINESDEGLEGMSVITPDGVNSKIFDYDDIPKYRRDIYKDCLTLFLEGLFG